LATCQNLIHQLSGKTVGNPADMLFLLRRSVPSTQAVMVNGLLWSSIAAIQPHSCDDIEEEQKEKEETDKLVHGFSYLLHLRLSTTTMCGRRRARVMTEKH